MTTKMKTAEWNCTRCGATNRKLVPRHETEVEDRCVTCHAKHFVKEDVRPVRWLANARK